MGLNIKNEHVHDLAKEAARLTGMSQTGVIEAALERYLADVIRPDGAARLTRVHEILADVDRRLTDADRAALTTDDLYDKAGMPR